MPLSPDQLHKLLDNLDGTLGGRCDHTHRHTAALLRSAGLDPDAVLPWLRDNGGYCDCEVLYNLYDLAESLRPSPPPPPRRKPKNHKPRSLENVAGWDLSSLPAPWRVADRSDPVGPIRLQTGKKGGCTLEIVEEPTTLAGTGEDAWASLYAERTELPPDGQLHVRRDLLDLPSGFTAEVVWYARWLPVLGWVAPGSGDWHLELTTDTRRMEGDFAAIASLIGSMAASDG